MPGQNCGRAERRLGSGMVFLWYEGGNRCPFEDKGRIGYLLYAVVPAISHVVGHTVGRGGGFSLRPTSLPLEHLDHIGVSHARLGRLEPLRDQNGFV